MREVVRCFLASGNYKDNIREGTEQNVVGAKLKLQLQVTWHKMRFLQMSER
jgi:hypothetical protein